MGRVIDYKHTIVSFEKESTVIRNVNKIEKEQNYALDNHSHGFFQLIYVTNGTLEVIADKRYECCEGDTIVIPPGQLHSLKSDNGYAQIGIDFYMCDDEENPYHILSQTFLSTFWCHIPSSISHIKNIIKKIDDYSIIGTQLLLSYINIFLFSLAEHHAMSDVSFFGKKLSEYLDNHLDSEISIELVAKNLLVSTSHLQRLCHQCYGVGVKTLYNRKRYSKACNLLLGTDLPVGDIAEECGFASIASFSAFFKKNSGVPPIKYRKNNII